MFGNFSGFSSDPEVRKAVAKFAFVERGKQTIAEWAREFDQKTIVKAGEELGIIHKMRGMM